MTHIDAITLMERDRADLSGFRVTSSVGRAYPRSRAA